MLTSVRFGRYKSLVDATLPLSTLTVLVGANASGKSNAIEALQLLHWLAFGISAPRKKPSPTRSACSTAGRARESRRRRRHVGAV